MDGPSYSRIKYVRFSSEEIAKIRSEITEDPRFEGASQHEARLRFVTRQLDYVEFGSYDLVKTKERAEAKGSSMIIPAESVNRKEPCAHDLTYLDFLRSECVSFEEFAMHAHDCVRREFCVNYDRELECLDRSYPYKI